LGTCPKHSAHDTIKIQAPNFYNCLLFLSAWWKKKSELVHAAPPSLWIRMKVASWEHSLVQETLDSI